MPDRIPAIVVRDDAHAKELTERLAEINGYIAEKERITKALKEWCGLDTVIEIYHDGKTMTWGASKSEGKYPAGDLRNPWTVPRKNNPLIFTALLNHGASKAEAWGCFKAGKTEIEKAVKRINNPEFNARLAALVDFDTAPRYGFKTVGKEEENNGDELQ